MYRLGKLEFEIAEARLVGRLGESLRWDLRVATLARSLYGERWAPNVRFEEARIRFEETPTGTRLVPSLEEETDEAPVSHYVFGHHEVREVEIRWGTNFGVEITGITDVFWDDDLSTDVPLRIACPVAVEVVTGDHGADAIARALTECGLGHFRLAIEGPITKVLP